MSKNVLEHVYFTEQIILALQLRLKLDPTQCRIIWDLK